VQLRIGRNRTHGNTSGSQEQSAGSFIVLDQREEQATGHAERLVLRFGALGRFKDQILAVSPLRPKAAARARLQGCGAESCDRRHPVFIAVRMRSHGHQPPGQRGHRLWVAGAVEHSQAAGTDLAAQPV